jgi:hypothetical protein
MLVDSRGSKVKLNLTLTLGDLMLGVIKLLAKVTL